MMDQTQSRTWPWMIAIGLGIAALYLVQDILLPFTAGLLVAYAMTPAVRCMSKWGVPRGIGSLLMIVGFMVIIGGLIFIALPFMNTEFMNLAKHMPDYVVRLRGILEPVLDDLSTYFEPSDINRIRETATSHVVDAIRWGVRFLAGILTNGLALANLISLIVITPIVAFYFLRDWEKILATIDGFLPRSGASSIRKVASDINDTIGGFAKGQATVCLVLAVYYMVMLTLVDLDFSVTVGLVIGFMCFIPYVGAITGFVLSMGIALAQFSDWTSIALVGAVFAVGQSMEGYLLVPNLVGDRIGLHPVWVIFSILAGGVIFGFVGILIALPVAAAIGVLVRFGLDSYRKSSYYLGDNSTKKAIKAK